jgi:hypothetical protein
LFLIVSAYEHRAYAQDRFEIQVYDVETAPRGGVVLETHVNVMSASTAASAVSNDAPSGRQTHLTFEPHVGLARWCELGAYLQAAFDPDGVARWGGFKGRFKMRLPHRYVHGVIGLALNVELSVVPARYESNVYGSELRPIVEFAYRRLYASINPILSIDLAGTEKGRPQLEPAAKLAVVAAAGVSVGAEYYAGLGAITGFLALAQQTHRLFAVIDVTREITKRFGVSVNFGVGADLIGSGDRLIVKTIVGIGR